MLILCKNNANRMQSKMNKFIFYAEMPPILIFSCYICAFLSIKTKQLVDE